MKSVLITGCSNGGLGSSLALSFQKCNYHVFATARTVSKMSDLADLPNITFLPLDVIDNSQITDAVASVSEITGGKLDYLVSNAGNNRYMPVLDEDLDACRALFEVNVWGALAVIKAFSGLVAEAKGVVVGISSVGGYVNTPYMGIFFVHFFASLSTYAATKRSLEIYLDTLRLELAPFGVRVVSVITGSIKSKGNTYFDDLVLPEDSLYKPAEESVLERANWEDGVPRESADKWSEKVVGRLTRGATGHIWAGMSAETI
ncbi:putative hydroxybutyrate dehydrogenase [Aspergillus crustosus]